MKDSVGVIFGDTGSLNFKFAAADSTAVRRSDYVKVWHESDGWVLAQINSIKKSNSDFSFEKAVDVAGGAKVEEMDEKIIAEATVIGSRDRNGLLQSPRTPFSPGDKVFKADHDLIRSTLGLTKGNIYIGYLNGQDIPVILDANNLVQKHCSILAKTGSGKSYTAAVILEELLDRNVPLLIIDPHGEYGTLKLPNVEKSGDDGFRRYNISPKGYSEQVTVYTPSNRSLNPAADELFRLNSMNMGIKDFSQLFPDEGQNQMAVLYEAITNLRRRTDKYSLDDLIAEVDGNKSKTKWSVISQLEKLRETGLFSDKPTSLNDLMTEGRASIIDMKGVDPNIQGMIVAKLCNDLFEARKLKLVPPGMIVIEEAHNFCPEKGFDTTVSTDILRTIASEGRKFGLGLMVISQRPARVDKNVLSQCGTQIIMKVTNPNDLKAISKGLEGIGSDVEEEIKRLPPGVAMLVSSYIERPVMVDVRIRKSKHGGESIAILKPPIAKTSGQDKKGNDESNEYKLLDNKYQEVKLENATQDTVHAEPHDSGEPTVENPVLKKTKDLIKFPPIFKKNPDKKKEIDAKPDITHTANKDIEDTGVDLIESYKIDRTDKPVQPVKKTKKTGLFKKMFGSNKRRE